MSNGKLTVIIPSLNPDEKLLRTVKALEEQGFDSIILVNDGSKEECLSFFPDTAEHPSCTLLHHKKNRGKGAALKTAFKYILEFCPDTEGVITADGDGQHLAKDILACGEKMLQTESVVLGCRDFNGDNVPKRSRFGNHTTSKVFRLLLGMKISDTQTGLRAFPRKYLADMLEVKGDRFEYETNMLISFKQRSIPYTEQTIDTVYIEENKTSHFRPIRDSVRIYKFILGYLLSSLASAGIDAGAFYLFLKFIPAGHMSILVSTLLARLISSLANFTINKTKVFSSKVSTGKALLKYYALAIPQMFISAFGTYLISFLFSLMGVTLVDVIVTVIKIVVDGILFLVSFRLQNNWVFLAKKKEQVQKKTKLSLKKVIGRIFVSVLTLIMFFVLSVFTLVFAIAHGPSPTIRNALVLSAKQASATKWVPSLFLDAATVEKIVADSQKVSTETFEIEDVGHNLDKEWEKAVDGMLYYEIKGPTYKAYMLIIRDPSRVTVGVSSDNFKNATGGARFYEIAEKYNALVALNAGEFADYGGVGSGAQPMGITFSQGKLVWNDGRTNRTYIGFDSNNTLIVKEGMTLEQAQAAGMRDLVAFQNNNVLIERDGDTVKVHNKSADTGTAQRTAIGQRADGAVIMLVTDGRTASSLGATPSDVIGMMLEYGAVSAAMLDGGSSTMMYYRDYYDKYDVDKDMLDQYQKMGLVNKYKAFTTPRRIPTWFIVSQ